ncbi:uncharacterized protein [Salminus brasiliensis]|uniref:uncharacterized protein n=1 Tax=Salminus brasiliensis TaxID=930266 RepID=UPI003B831A56
MKSSRSGLCVLLLLTTALNTGLPLVTVKLHDSAVLPCSESCSGVVRWTVFHKRSDVLAECDQTSCRSVKEGYRMIHDQYLKGDLSLTITGADFSKRGLYTSDCGGKDVCDVRLQIEGSDWFFSSAVNSTVQRLSGESLLLNLFVSDPVEVVYHSAGAHGSSGQICTVDGRSSQCEPEYTKRASVISALELRGLKPSDNGVYTVMDTRTKEVIHICTVDVPDVQQNWIWKDGYEKGNSDGYWKGLWIGGVCFGIGALVLSVLLLCIVPRLLKKRNSRNLSEEREASLLLWCFNVN